MPLISRVSEAQQEIKVVWGWLECNRHSSQPGGCDGGMTQPVLDTSRTLHPGEMNKLQWNMLHS